MSVLRLQPMKTFVSTLSAVILATATLTSAHAQEIISVALPSGGTAQIIMEVTAGDAIVATGLMVLIGINAFTVIRQLAHGAKTK